MTSFCPAPWTQLSTTTDGRVRTCCHMSGNKVFLKKNNKDFFHIHEDETSDFWNSNDLVQLRKDLLQNKKPDSCIKCWSEEKAGATSQRMRLLKKHKLDPKELTAKTDLLPTYLDFRFSNRCNLKCRTCGPFNSSLWSQDWEEVETLAHLTSDGSTYDKEKIKNLSSFNWLNNEFALKQIKVLSAKAEEIYITGGEPTIIEGHKEYLQQMIDLGLNKSIRLKYNTNLARIDEELIHLWKKFKRVRFNCSIDSVGKINSYIRHPSCWETTVRNLNKLRELENTDIEIACTVSILNIFSLNELFDFVEKENLKAHLIFVRDPKIYSITTLPNNLKEEVTQLLNKKDYSNTISNYSAIKNILNSEDTSHLFEKFQKVTKVLDKLRGESLLKIIPKLS